MRVLKRVEPEYPEAARQQHIQGPVVSEGKVGKDGAVRQLTVINGKSILATAAPPCGSPVAFQTPCAKRPRGAVSNPHQNGQMKVRGECRSDRIRELDSLISR